MPIPKPKSVGEETFWLHCQAYLRDIKVMPIREYQFDEDRKWRLDFYWPEYFLAVEVDGGTSHGKSRHSRGAGYENDCRKLNAALRLGIVLRFTTAMVVSGEAINAVMNEIKRRQNAKWKNV